MLARAWVALWKCVRERELVEDLTVKAEYVPTAENVADILTKALARRQFEKLRTVLLNYAPQVWGTGG